ncbi:MAG: haloacid dehalogenase type II [Rhodospirillales bacterium]|nr:haloacid dehalogenase type II [Rhodospirillales bacterium]MDE2197744.1 haloacid dehalogenase type II [Rhodospirillales bacterium]MDE2575130.1 haloacid dehalogenase type II [Rhodospirillales bacterium]
MKLTDFRVLTFDCYGTLIDWESGIHAALQPLLARSGSTLPRDTVLEHFAQHESAQEAETPGMIYSALLAEVHRRLAAQWQVATTSAEDATFGASVPDWPAFADTASALQYLKRHYKLVILSNVDRESFKGSNKRLGVAFDAIYTAQDIGSYKPNPANFRYMLDHLGALGYTSRDILHTAQSLFHDHAPAQQFGLARAWIDRRHDRAGWGATMAPPEGAAYDFRFSSLGEMVKAHQEELRG